MDELIMMMRKVTNTHKALNELKTTIFFVTLLKHQKSSHVFTFHVCILKGPPHKNKPRENFFHLRCCVFLFRVIFQVERHKTHVFYYHYFTHIFFVYSDPTSFCIILLLYPTIQSIQESFFHVKRS